MFCTDTFLFRLKLSSLVWLSNLFSKVDSSIDNVDACLMMQTQHNTNVPLTFWWGVIFQTKMSSFPSLTFCRLFRCMFIFSSQTSKVPLEKTICVQNSIHSIIQGYLLECIYQPLLLIIHSVECGSIFSYHLPFVDLSFQFFLILPILPYLPVEKMINICIHASVSSSPFSNADVLHLFLFHVSLPILVLHTDYIQMFLFIDSQ